MVFYRFSPVFSPGVISFRFSPGFILWCSLPWRLIRAYVVSRCGGLVTISWLTPGFIGTDYHYSSVLSVTINPTSEVTAGGI